MIPQLVFLWEEFGLNRISTQVWFELSIKKNGETHSLMLQSNFGFQVSRESGTPP